MHCTSCASVVLGDVDPIVEHTKTHTGVSAGGAAR
jgi:hypothetical protein